MAIDRLQDVFPAHQRRVIGLAVFLELSILVTLTALLMMTGLDLITTLVFVIMPVAVLNIFALIVIGRYALEPLNFLSRTVTHVSGQPHDSVPPNLNGTRHEKTGFKMMIDTIYGITQRNTEPAADAISSSLTSAILDKLPGGVIALGEDRTILYANTTAPIHSDNNGVKSIQLLFDGDDTLEKWLANVETTQVSASKIWRHAQTTTPGEEGRRVFDVVASYQKGGAGGIETLLLLFDQTAYYAVNEENMDFIALAAHELRGPVTVIRGYLDVLRPELDNTLNADQRQLFDRLDVSTSRLSGYVSNILNVSKYDRRHLILHLHEDRLLDIYATVADDLALRASTQGRLLTINIPAELPTVAADRSSLSEVMANIVDNAIKYSREGGQVVVTGATDGNFVRFSVQDFGIGIPASVIGSLFTKFYRSHRSKANVAGTGLGLYISKAIVESHGGNVALTSTEGQGSTFSFSVPIYATVAEKLASNNSENQGIMETSSGWIKNHSMYRG